MTSHSTFPTPYLAVQISSNIRFGVLSALDWFLSLSLGEKFSPVFMVIESTDGCRVCQCCLSFFLIFQFKPVLWPPLLVTGNMFNHLQPYTSENCACASKILLCKQHTKLHNILSASPNRRAAPLHSTCALHTGSLQQLLIYLVLGSRTGSPPPTSWQYFA